MFNNIGKKIKTLAYFVFLIGIIGSIVSSIILFAQSHGDGAVILFGFLSLVIGPILSWVFSWFIYAWGDIVDNVQSIKEKQCGIDFSEQEKVKKSSIKDKLFNNIFKNSDSQKQDKNAILSQNKLEKMLSSGQITFEEYNKLMSKK